MNDEKYSTTGRRPRPSSTTRTHDANRDPITGAPGAHPVGTGVGAAAGAVTGAAIGGAVGGPVGAVVGAAVGGVAGGLAGKGVAEGVNPTEEDAYWRNNYSKRPYAANRSYDDLAPAYQYGYTSAAHPRGPQVRRRRERPPARLGAGQGQVSARLERRQARHQGRLEPGRRPRRERQLLAGEPFLPAYYKNGHTYDDDYAPAYRYGYDSASTHAGRKFDETENDLQHGWEQTKGKSKLAWSDAKHAVKEAGTASRRLQRLRPDRKAELKALLALHLAHAQVRGGGRYERREETRLGQTATAEPDHPADRAPTPGWACSNASTARRHDRHRHRAGHRRRHRAIGPPGRASRHRRRGVFAHRLARG